MPLRSFLALALLIAVAVVLALVLAPSDPSAPPARELPPPAHGARLVVRVVPPAGARPAALAELAVTPVRLAPARDAVVASDAMALTRSAMLGADHEVVLDEVPAGVALELSFEPRWLLPAPRSRLFLAEGEVRELVLAPARGAVVEGRVVDETGASLESVAVRVSPEPSRGWRPAYTRADGTFRVEPVPPGDVFLRADSAQRSVSVRGLADGEVRTGVELVAPRAGRVDVPPLVGQVVDAVGSPEAFAIVNVWTQGPAGALERAGWDASGEDGWFRIAPRRLAERYVVVARTDDAIARLDDVPAGADGLELVLGPGERLAGRVEDAEGFPATSFRVRVEPVVPPLRANLRGGGPTLVDADGAFEVTGLDAGAWRVRAVAADGAASPWASVVVPQETPLVLRVRATASIEGRVVDADGRPVAARVSVQELPSAGAGGSRVQGQFVDADADGRFAVEGLAPGRVAVRAAAQGLAPAAVLAHTGEASAPLELVLREPGALEVALHAALGERAGRAVSVARRGDGSLSSAGVDAAGRARLEGLAPGTYDVHLEPRSPIDLAVSARVEVESGATARVLLGAPRPTRVRLEGRVTRAGEPLANLPVRAWPLAGAIAEDELAIAQALTDAAGRYVLRLAEAGEHALFLGPELGPDAELVWPPFCTLRRVTVADERRVVHDVALGTAVLRGTVRDAAGAPLPDVRVRAWRSSAELHELGPFVTRWTDTDAAGAFELAMLDPGAWTVCAGGESSPWDLPPPSGVLHGAVSRDVEVEDPAVRSGESRATEREPSSVLDFTLPEPGALHVRVELAAEAGATRLLLRDAAGRALPPLEGLRLDVARADGAVEVRVAGLAPGVVTLVAIADPDVPGREPVELGHASASVRAGETASATVGAER